ncbi:zinc finger protein [Saccharopolyspora sp. 6V]|uniref:zinc finger protein n=1 Tax=Saccharopolyspora sp. 6V TaxID=2877239 RepID=UPI001CD2C882|nr:zinc finger protein [Saccharopolyspora sp. 6V]MCA1192047.1 hypothetical protein [Saccharopolyspora sp. 6V]
MPYPFHWFPADGRRHATLDQRPRGGFPATREVTALCGRELTADDAAEGWFWPTCRGCAPETRRIAAADTALDPLLFG